MTESRTASYQTSSAFIWSRILGTPFWVMINTLSLILYKEFHVSPLLITLFIALKPATALIASYVSCFLWRHEKRLISTLILTNVIRFAPFLLLFFISSPYWILGAFCIYMTLSRGAVPAWMELFKRHISTNSQSKVFALGNAFEYLGATLLPLALGLILDNNPQAWKSLFVSGALLGVLSSLFLIKIPLVAPRAQEIPPLNLLEPWKRSWKTLKDNRPFAKYLLGFMLGGAGLMIIQPVLPFFFVDVLDLSYTEMILALTVCKGIGFTLSSPFWVSLFRKLNLYSFSALIALLASLFLIILVNCQMNVLLIYAAYLLYGFMQSGSELSWHMSPLFFSQEKSSLPFSEVNILAVGVRGCFIPFFGNFLFYQFNSMTVMVLGSLFCLTGTFVLYLFSRPIKISVDCN